MFTIHPFSFLSQCMRGYFCKIRARAIEHIANYDMVCDIVLGVNVHYHSKAQIYNGNDPNYIVTFHESEALPFVFVIR